MNFVLFNMMGFAILPVVAVLSLPAYGQALSVFHLPNGHAGKIDRRDS